MPNRASTAVISQPGWRNWQTQRTQNPPGFGPWGFEPPSRHQQNKGFRVKMASRMREAILLGGCSDGCSFLTFSKCGCFAQYLGCHEVQENDIPGFAERSRGRIGIKAAH